MRASIRPGTRHIALDRLEERWPGITAGMESRRQMHNGASHLWLPVELPHWLAASPRPFMYLVDSFQELEENALWCRRRANLVADELVVDLSANVQRTSTLFPSRPFES